MKYVIMALVLCLSGCAHVSPYGHGCRDGVKDLEPQLGAIGAALVDGDALDRYCDAVEAKHSKDQGNRGK